MKLKLIIVTLFLLNVSITYAQQTSQMSYEAMPTYGYRPDGKPGRELKVIFPEKLTSKAVIEVSVNGKTEKTDIEPTSNGMDSTIVMLPEGVGVTSATQIAITLKSENGKYKKTVKIPAMRLWNIYLYNHAHVDIGYTNTHKNVEILHKTNIREGIKLARETANYPFGAKYRWNPEVTWPLERLWMSNPEEREDIIKAIKDGELCIDANYLNLNTSICSDEELFHTFDFSRKMQGLTGVDMDVFQQMDIPGMSWGLVSVMAQQGVKYIMSWPNSDRAGNAHKDLDGKPYWWIGPDGKSKVLFLQPGGYANSGSMKKGGETGRPWFGQRDPEKVPAVIKTGSADVDFTDKVVTLENSDYPYDFTVLSWSLWDNCPLDADVPHAVKEWNERYAYPKIIISGAHEIMSMIETKYGDVLPEIRGDYTEYWSDGVGTAARLTAMNRISKERLAQAETIWSMLRNGKAASRDEFDEAWRYIALGSEHTYCAENPAEPYFQDAIWKVKQSYYHEAEDRSITLLDESLATATDKSSGALGHAFGPANGGVAVFNTQSWIRDGVVTLKPSESRVGNRVTDESGNEIASQRLSTGELIFFAKEVPALGSRHYRVVEGDAKKFDGCKIEGTTLLNGAIRVVIDPKSGNITTFEDTASGYNYAGKENLNTFSWLPANVDAPKADSVIRISVVENGPLAVELLVESTAVGCRKILRSVKLFHGTKYADITNCVDKLPLLEKDGIHFGFDFNIPQSIAKADIPWGVMEIEKDQWPQANRNWIAVQRWVDVSNDSKGVTWCSIDAPLIEYGTRSANIALGWGDKGPWLTKLEKSSKIYSWAMNNHWHTNFPTSQDGEVVFRYRLLAHDKYDVVEANRFGVEQAQPLVHVAADKNPQLKPAVEVDNSKVYVTILKPTDKDGVTIIRLRSLSADPEEVKLSFPGGEPAKVSVCRIDEIASESVGNEVIMKPYGLLTIRFER